MSGGKSDVNMTLVEATVALEATLNVLREGLSLEEFGIDDMAQLNALDNNQQAAVAALGAWHPPHNCGG